MKHLELHILQSFPVSCLNRDDFGSPKTAIFGGVPRARVSSQCEKRAARELMQEASPEYFAGRRTRLIIAPLRDLLMQKHGLSEADAQSGAEALGTAINKLDTPPERIKTLFFTSATELETLASGYAGEEGTPAARAKKALKALAKTLPKDAADLALFGRMVANDHALTLEGAAMFGHALSTHRVSNEIDFFSAVDDLKPSDEDAGAGMTGTLEFNSATYYRFAALNLDMLADSRHLGALTVEERQQVVRMFVEAVIRAVPSARQNSMNVATLPSFVLLVVREKGHPVQLVNAFEEPVWSPRGGLVAASRKKLEEEYASLQATWGITASAEFRIPDMPLNEALEEVVKHVV